MFLSFEGEGRREIGWLRHKKWALLGWCRSTREGRKCYREGKENHIGVENLPERLNLLDLENSEGKEDFGGRSMGLRNERAKRGKTFEGEVGGANQRTP